MSASVSPSFTSTAMGAPISPASPAASTIRPTTPASSALYSTIAFSVSISASGSPTATVSPGATSQLAMAASVAPASTLGIRTTDAISRPFPKPARTRSRPAATSSVRAIAARSSTFEMLGLASEPVTRCTGWSSQSKKRRWTSSASQPP